MNRYMLSLLFLPAFAIAQNEVCLDLVDNPNSNSQALSSFTTYVNVLDCIDIYGESQVSDEKVLHAAAIAAELLDNNEDGIVDDPAVENALRNSNAMMPIFNSEWSNGQDNVFDYYNGCLGAALYRNEMDPSQPGHWGSDASVEEILHTINTCGQLAVYPEAFGLATNSSLMSDAMDVARGGQFINIPNNYPEEAWYHYDDYTCDYECMAMEYLYWCIVTDMGILNDTQTCNGIANEWEPCSPELFESTDIAMHAIINNPNYKLPQDAPDGNYCPTQGTLGDLNGDGVINILDIISTVNIILGTQPFNPLGDLNGDGGINILDVVSIVNIILASTS
ncbi:MAG: hypothetical protein H8E72_08735 [Candidatus Marinimicrobia bacterium]|nr:hypothetical protein [Candidatus Neomarinimicrobiota bacterium]